MDLRLWLEAPSLNWDKPKPFQKTKQAACLLTMGQNSSPSCCLDRSDALTLFPENPINSSNLKILCGRSDNI